MAEGFKLARKVESILSGTPKRVFLIASSPVTRFGSSVTPFVGSVKPVTSPYTRTIAISAHGFVNTSNSFRALSRGISPALIAEREKKGLCFWCGNKYYVGHKCVKGQLYQMLKGFQSEDKGDNFHECVEQLEEPSGDVKQTRSLFYRYMPKKGLKALIP